MTAARDRTIATDIRRLPVGAEPAPGGGVHFRVWAPDHARVTVVLEGGAGGGAELTLEREADGYFAGTAADAAPGTCYRFRLDDEGPFPDPVSRFQPEGPHGPSEVVDAGAFAWSDDDWTGLAVDDQVLYELHVGTLTREGTWAAAARMLSSLAELGVTAIEVMPVADFPGRFNWGYDGVALFAPCRLYGTPSDMRAFVDRAHALGIGVLLDVVYNHFGPDGCYLRQFAAEYFSTRHASEWGESPNFDGPRAGPVRELFLANAAYWIDEFHLDGLRLDATQSIHDDTTPHVLTEIGERVRRAAQGRGTLVVNENEPQESRLVRPVERGGYGLDMIWNDDWHHSALVALAAQDEAYYTDYRGSPQELLSAAKHGFLFQGQWYRWQHKRRGTPSLDVKPERFVHFLENHDQVANSGRGERPVARASHARWRALTALLLLGPQTPMLLQGQEWEASAPFLFFADHSPELARLVAKGRLEFMAQFANLALPEVQQLLPAPESPDTFARCKLDHEERTRGRHAEAWAMHRDLIRLRREDAGLVHARAGRSRIDGSVLGPDAFALRWIADASSAADEPLDRLLVVSLGRSLHLDPAPEPLLAPPEGTRWRIGWSSQDPRYGGIGALAPDAPETDRSIPNRPDVPRPWENWRVQGETALFLLPTPITPRDRRTT